MMDIGALRTQFQGILGTLDERRRRLFATNEALALGRGGVTALSAASGMARSTINRGIAQSKAGYHTLPDSIRRTGSARNKVSEHQPGLLKGLEELIEGAIRGDQEPPLRLVSRSQTHLAAELRHQNFEGGEKLVGKLLPRLKYSFNANRKTREGFQHPDTNAQFDWVRETATVAIAAGEPTISVEAKRKELIGI
jgi:hypothetical protein